MLLIKKRRSDAERNNKAAKRIMELTMDAEVIIIGGGAAGAMAGYIPEGLEIRR